MHTAFGNTAFMKPVDHEPENHDTHVDQVELSQGKYVVREDKHDLSGTSRFRERPKLATTQSSDMHSVAHLKNTYGKNDGIEESIEEVVEGQRRAPHSIIA